MISMAKTDLYRFYSIELFIWRFFKQTNNKNNIWPDEKKEKLKNILKKNTINAFCAIVRQNIIEVLYMVFF